MMPIAGKTWTEHGTTVHVLTTTQDGLSPASAAVRAIIRSLDSTQKAETDGTIHYIGRWPDPSGAAA